MRTTIEQGTSQKGITEIARNANARYIVIWSDHYGGNNKGYYQTVESFENSDIFFWSTAPNDRGALKVIITDEDVPGMIARKKELMNSFNDAYYSMNQELSQLPKSILFDGRLGKNNPIRIEAETRNNEIKSLRIAVENKYNSLRQEITKEIQSIWISSTMIEIKL